MMFFCFNNHEMYPLSCHICIFTHFNPPPAGGRRKITINNTTNVDCQSHKFGDYSQLSMKKPLIPFKTKKLAENRGFLHFRFVRHPKFGILILEILCFYPY